MKKLKATRSRRIVVTGLMVALMLVSAASFLMAGKDKKVHEESAKGFLGVNIEKMSSDDREEFGVRFGVLVTGVSKGEAAEKAGIQKYDVIQYFNDERMRRPSDLMEAVRHSKPGSKATVKIVRDGKTKTMTATLGEAKDHFKFFSKDGKKFIWKGGGDKLGFDILRDGDKDIKVISKGFYGSSKGAFLGVNLQNFEDENFAQYFGVKPGEGALITKVYEDTPAEKAGLKKGDVITKLDGKKISNPKDVTKLLAKKKKGDKVEIRVMRHKKQKTVKAELAKRKGFGKVMFFGDHDNIHLNVPKIHFKSGHYDSDHEGHGDIIIEKKKVNKEKKLHKEYKKKKKKTETHL